MNTKQWNNEKRSSESLSAVSNSGFDDGSTTSLADPPRKKHRAHVSCTDDASFDADFDLTTVSGQAAAHPDWSLQNCRAAAKKEYNRRNAARARIRNKNLMADLQARVVHMSQREEALLNENSLLRAQVQVYKEQLDILSRESGLTEQISLLGTSSLAAQSRGETQESHAKAASRPLLDIPRQDIISGRGLSETASAHSHESEHNLLASLLRRPPSSPSFPSGQSILTALNQSPSLLTSVLQGQRTLPSSSSLASNLLREADLEHFGRSAVRGVSALPSSGTQLSSQQTLEEIIFRQLSGNGSLR